MTFNTLAVHTKLLSYVGSVTLHIFLILTIILLTFFPEYNLNSWTKYSQVNSFVLKTSGQANTGSWGMFGQFLLHGSLVLTIGN